MFWSKQNKNVENKVVEETNNTLSNAQLEVELENFENKRNELIGKPYFGAAIHTDNEIKGFTRNFFPKYMLDGTIDFNKIASCIDHDDMYTSSENNTTEKRWYFNGIEPRYYIDDSYRCYNNYKDPDQYVAIKYYAKSNKYFVEGRVKTGVKFKEVDGVSYNETEYYTFKSEGYDDLNSLKQAVANFVEIVNLDAKINKIRTIIEDNNRKQKCKEIEAQAWG